MASIVSPSASPIDAAFSNGVLAVVHQPIVDLDLGWPVGYEALARFDLEPRQGPDVWFAAAHRAGCGAELEALAVERALETLPLVPGDCYLAINVSPDTILTPRLQALLTAVESPERIVLEVTEHAAVADYDALAAALAPHRRRGLQLAIDDTGAGFASLRHVLRLEPDVIKLDRWFADRVERDRGARALAGALAMFALEMEITAVAEGIERPAQLTVLHNLGVTRGQGYLFARPAALTAVTG
jgi:EAL domain-containing protein (putative c-di-GMP-specific phosphodiesterase class I)